MKRSKFAWICMIWLTSSLASPIVFCSSKDITNRNVHIKVGSTVNCSVIAFDSEDRKLVLGQITAAVRTHTYIVGPIMRVPYKLNLEHEKTIIWRKIIEEKEKKRIIELESEPIKVMKFHSHVNIEWEMYTNKMKKKNELHILNRTLNTFSNRTFASFVFPPKSVRLNCQLAIALHTKPFHEGFYIRWKCERIFWTWLPFYYCNARFSIYTENRHIV